MRVGKREGLSFPCGDKRDLSALDASTLASDWHPGEPPSWKLSSLSQALGVSFMAKLKVKRPPSLPPAWARWGEAEIPLGRAGGGVHTHKLCFGFLLLTNAFSGGCPSHGGESPKKGFKSSPL